MAAHLGIARLAERLRSQREHIFGVHGENLNRDTANLSQPYYPGSIERKVIVPLICARMIQTNDLTGVNVASSDIGAFVEVAVRASQRQIALDSLLRASPR